MDCGINMLMHVAAARPADDLRQFMTMGPNLNASDNIGRTALHLACRAGRIDNF